MNTKKIVLVVVGIIAGLCLIGALVGGAIIGGIFYGIGHSQAAQTAQIFLRQNEKLKQDVGDIKDFGTFATGAINALDNDGAAIINLKVIGVRRTTNAAVHLLYRNGHDWRVVSATYKNAAGSTIELAGNYESEERPDLESLRVPNDSEHVTLTNDDSFDADVLRADAPVLVEFVSTYSEEGRRLQPAFDCVAEQYAGRVTFMRYNTDDNSRVYQQANIVALPTLVLYEHGQETERVVGAISQADLSRLMAKHLRR